jgi:DNA-directed RNA polymerase subunit RPC12/RpoP
MKKILFGLMVFFILSEPAYAFAISNDMYTYTNIIAAGMVFIGIIIIIISKMSGGNKDIYVEKEKNKISGLTDEDKLNVEKEFNPDSIFKTLPTFSSKNFEDNIKEVITNLYTGNVDKTKHHIKEELTTNTEVLEEFKINDFKIIDFIEEDNRYLIKSKLLIECGPKKEKIKKILNITSVNKKSVQAEIRCPVCGGKIKDPTKLRCIHCGTILPNNNELNNDKWIIEEIEKTT